MAANKRLHMGDKLKRIPMGYFNDQSLGELTGIATTILDEVESAGAMVLVTILGGLINSAVMLLCVLFWDWRIGLLAWLEWRCTCCSSPAWRNSPKSPPKRQRDEARLVEAVLEQPGHECHQILLNLTGKGDKRVRQALENSRKEQSGGGKLFTPYIWAQEMALHLFSVVILAAAVAVPERRSVTGQRPDVGGHLLPDLFPDPVRGQRRVSPRGWWAAPLTMPIRWTGSLRWIRMVRHSTRTPHDIVFDHVDFSYGSRPILKDVSLTIPDRTTTAIVGPPAPARPPSAT